MAKGQKKSNKETRKPKQTPTPPVANPTLSRGSLNFPSSK